MPAEVESMFYVRETPWHGLGTNVDHALNSNDAITLAGLDWNVIQKEIRTVDDIPIPNVKANIRDSDNRVLGIVSNRYKVVQNLEAFRFTDELLGGDILYETAGSLQGGRKVWLLAKLSKEYNFIGDEITPYLVLSNSHDGNAPVRVAMTPIRVVCQNTLNLALKTASRSWSVRHTSSIHNAIHEAKETLGLAQNYMKQLEKELLSFHRIKIDDNKLKQFVNILIPKPYNASSIKADNIDKMRDDIYNRFYKAPDLVNIKKTGYRFLNAVSDHQTHFKPFRYTDSYQENLLIKTMESPQLLDKLFALLKEAV